MVTTARPPRQGKAMTPRMDADAVMSGRTLKHMARILKETA